MTIAIYWQDFYRQKLSFLIFLRDILALYSNTEKCLKKKKKKRDFWSLLKLVWFMAFQRYKNNLIDYQSFHQLLLQPAHHIIRLVTF